MSTLTRSLAIHALVLSVGMPAVLTGATGEPDEIPVAEPLAYVRLYCDSDGESHFADEAMPFTLVEFAPPAPPVSVSTAMAAEVVAIISSPPSWHGDWHPAPRRQLMFVLSGEVEVEVTDGEVRRLTTGAIALVEDTACKGHVSRIVGGSRAYIANVPLRAE